VRGWCRQRGYGEVTAARPVGGGCINHGARLETASGRALFLKTNRSAPAEMFAREADGLKALRVADGPRLPEPFVWGESFLLMEYLAPAARRADYWPAFGRQLASLHSHVGERFGFDHDNFIGSTPQPNPWTDDGYTFFAQQRLLFQARLAHQRHLLGKRELALAERLAQRLPELAPVQPASLIHGDLWGGNAITDASGAPALIDPAAHYGWAEAELAMTALFGAFPESFYGAYREARPLQPGFSDRIPIYNLYHLLNHLNLFGEGYLGEVVEILHRYS
jgi:fructosamine-3-kinase